MKVSFLVPDLGWPIVGIAARMANYLHPEHEVEIVGPNLWRGANIMYAAEFAYRPVDCPRLYRLPEYFRESRKLTRALTGDVIISMKAFGSNLPAALRAKRERGCRVVAYLDEWDGAVAAEWSWSERLRQWTRDWMHPGNNVYVPWVERRLRECDERLVTTQFLAQKFAGRIFHIGVDTARFQPQDPEAVARLKRQLGLSANTLLVFGGVARPHKGLEVFLEALVRLRRTDCRVVILGPHNEYVQQLQQHSEYGALVCCPATTPEAIQLIHREMPLYLGLGDALLVPLTDTLLARSQMPCKLFEAMAMGKPILANAVSDVPAVLGDGGYLLPPNDVAATAQAIQALLADPAGAAAMGQRARARCVAHYSAATSRQELLNILQALR
ncbi:MAG TPA: glycosyltransferase family 4 protein [Kiritimatiellia bacterium]|nr:glycosyltransferase family 4 protein [Kiritimatiellia bacterium]